jgi:hypothetical protein
MAMILLAGCSESGPAPDAAPPSSPATTAGSASPSPASAAPSASPALADGRSPVYLTGLSTNTVTFDLIEFLTGDAAAAEWKKQHPDEPDGPDNDYLIVNNNTRLRTLPVIPDATCVVLSSLGGTKTKVIGFTDLPAFLKKQNQGTTPAKPQIALLPFWLTVERGSVVRLEEQFLP